MNLGGDFKLTPAESLELERAEAEAQEVEQDYTDVWEEVDSGADQIAALSKLPNGSDPRYKGEHHPVIPLVIDHEGTGANNPANYKAGSSILKARRFWVDEGLNLEPREYEVIELYLANHKKIDIANALGITAVTVRNILSRPKVIAMIDELYISRKQDLQNLTGKAIDVIEEAMDDKELGMEVRLRAVDKVLKSQGFYDRKQEDAGNTAQQTVNQLFQLYQVQITK